MLDTTEIVALLGALPIRSNKAATSKAPMPLAKEQSNVLGTQKRTILRYVKIAINAISDKLEIQRITSEDTQTNDVLDTWLTQNKFDTLQRDIYKALVRDGITYVLVAYNDGVPVISHVNSYDGKSGAYAVHDGLTGKPVFTINVWNNGTKRNLDIYYPERIEKYFYDIDDSTWKPRYDYKGEKFPNDWTDDNGEALGIALVPFDIRESDITEAIQLQQDINEAHLDMLATSRTMGWPQRVLKNASKETYLLNQYEQPMLDITSYPIPRKIELTPGSILMLQGADSDLTQLPAADISTVAIDKIEDLISKFTTVPIFYFKGEFPSGVALLNAEMRLNHKVESHMGFITPAFETMLVMMIRVSNTFGTSAYSVDASIDITWYPPQIEDEELRMQKAESSVKNVTLLKSQGLISVQTAIQTLHPEWDIQQVTDEVNRIKAESSIVSL